MSDSEREMDYENWHKKNFNSQAYSKRFDHVSKTDDYFMMRLCDSFESGKHIGQRFLDVGCGPSFVSSLVASRVFSYIFLSDMCPSNLETLRKWIDKDAGVQDWSEHINYLAEREGMTPDIYENRFRQSVKGFCECDVTKDRILLAAGRVEPFDCVASSLCLEPACYAGFEEYRASVRRIRSLLNPVGTVVICGVLGSPCYFNDGIKFRRMSGTAPLVESAFNDSGFTHVEMVCSDVPEGHRYTGIPLQTYILTAVNPGKH